MNIKARRLVMYFFISAFFIIAPILLFYVSGYRLDFKRYMIIKTGTLFIEAKEIKKAELYINDKLQEKLFNEKEYIYNLLPGEYTVKLAEAGYHPWQKKTVIESGMTTFIKDAILFKNEIPLQIVDGQINNFALSPDKQKLVYTLENKAFEEYYLFDLNLNQKTFLYRTALEDMAALLAWAPSSKKILVRSENDYIVLDCQNSNNNLAIKNIMGVSPENLIWDQSSDNLLFGKYLNSIYSIDIFEKKSVKILTTEDKLNHEFLVEGKDIFYLTQQENKNTLRKYNLQFKTDKQVRELAKSDRYQFITGNKNFLEIINIDQQKLILIKKVISDLEITVNTNEPVKEFNAKDALWNEKNNQLLIYDDFEIISYFPDTNKQNLINRYGQLISKISWYPDYDHLVILLDNSLQIIDLTQEAGSRNALNLVKFDQLNNFDLDAKGQELFFNGSIGKQKGLYQLDLK